MISVIIAAYNAEKYIQECIDSVRNQTYKELEILIVDDGSTDKTWDIIQKNTVRDSRIIGIHQENQGPAAARNVAFEQMRGEYFTVIDSDDWIEKDCYEKAYQAAAETDADMVIWGLQRFDKNKVIPQLDPMLKIGLYKEEECIELWKDVIYREKRRVNPFVHCRLIKTSIINDNVLKMNPRLNRSEDYMFLCQVHFYCKRVFSMVDNMYLHYRQNEDSIIHNYVPEYFDMVMIIYEELIAFAKVNDVLTAEVQERIDRMCLYRTFMSIENEKLHEISQIERKKNIHKFLENPIVVATAKKIGFEDGLKLYGKKYIALRFNLAAILLKYWKG